MTEIDKCPKCGKSDGYDWTWSKHFDGTGFSTCKSCGGEFH